MTICFFSAQYLPTPGGVERYTWNLARKAVQHGCRALVVTSVLPGLPEQETDPDGIEIFRLPVWPVMKGRFPVLKPGRRFAALERRIFAQSIDLCVVQTRMYVESVWAARAAKRRGIPAVVIDHSTGYMPMGGGVIGLAGRMYEHAACALVRRTGAPFYGVSLASCRWLKTFGVDARGTMPNAIDPDALAAELAAPQPPELTRAALCPNGEKLVVFLGRMIPEKGIRELAAAVSALPGVVLAAAGDGPLLEPLRAEAPPRVHYLGALDHGQAVRLLAGADCYCLPTRYAEGLPTTLLEAAGCGCPILCTPTAGTEELLPGQRAFFLPDTAPDAIRAGLQALLENPAETQKRAAAAKQNALAHFTWDAVFDKLIQGHG